MRKTKMEKIPSFSTRLFVCVFTTAFLLLLIGGIVLFSFSIKTSSSMSNTMTLENLRITQENLDQLFQRVDDSVQMAFSQKDVLGYALMPLEIGTNARDTVQHALVMAVAAEDFISHISLCADTGEMLATAKEQTLPYTNYDNCLKYYSMQKEHLQLNGQSWTFLQKDPVNLKEYALTNVRTVQPSLLEKKKLVLAISVSEKELTKAYSFLGENSYIMRSNGTIVSAVDKSLIGTKADESIQRAISGKGTRLLFQEHDDFTYSIYLSAIDSFLVVRIKAQALSQTRNLMAAIAIAVLIIGFAFSLLWSKYITQYMTKPLKSLTVAMEEARKGNLEIRCKSSRGDEFGFLSESFNHMIDSIKTYIQQLDRQRELTKENEIRLLQAQINPHLLYNTLDSAVCLLDRNENTKSRQALTSLSNYFRLALQSGNKIITVRSAIQHVEAYLQIQKLCRMKNYDFIVVGDPELQNAKILHMLLQPIIENAVLHGFEGNYSAGTIKLILQRDEDKLLISVVDNGMGMEAYELNSLRKKVYSENPGTGGFALWNIVQRIRMSYGPQYGVEIESEVGEYTSVRLTLPYRE